MFRSKFVKTVLPYGLMLILCTIAFLPFFKNISREISDWDHTLFLFKALSDTTRNFLQFPFWNPWFLGGDVLFAHPTSPFFTPFSLLFLGLPLVIATKFNVFLHLVLAAWAMIFIARKMYGVQSIWLILLGAAIFVFNHYFFQHVIAAHLWILAYAYTPFTFYTIDRYLRSGSVQHLAWSAILLALIIFDGGVLILPSFLLFVGLYSVLAIPSTPPFALILRWVKLLVLATGLSALRLRPLIDYVQEQPDAIRNILHQIKPSSLWLLNPTNPFLDSGFVILILLCAVFLIAQRTRNGRSLIIILGLSLLQFFTKFPINGPFPLIICLVVGLIIFQAASQLESSIWLQRFSPILVRFIFLFISLLLIGNLLFVSYLSTHRKVMDGTDRARDNIADTRFAMVEPLIYSEHPETTHIYSTVFTPNKVIFTAEVPVADTIFLNQNFARGWKFNIKHFPVFKQNNHPAVNLEPGMFQSVHFYYRPNSFLKSVLLTMISALICLYFLAPIPNQNKLSDEADAANSKPLT